MYQNRGGPRRSVPDQVGKTAATVVVIALVVFLLAVLAIVARWLAALTGVLPL